MPVIGQSFVRGRNFKCREVEQTNFHVITGGPGVGKTTLIEGLRSAGFRCEDEVARAIIRQQMEIGGDALPWGDRIEYTRLMLAHSMASFERCTEVEGIVFFDRGIPDALAYAELIHLPDVSALEQAVDGYRYYSRVFILPPWKEIYCADAERKQSFEEAVETYEVMKRVYRKWGYDLIDVPYGTQREMVEFICERVGLG